LHFAVKKCVLIVILLKILGDIYVCFIHFEFQVLIASGNT